MTKGGEDKERRKRMAASQAHQPGIANLSQSLSFLTPARLCARSAPSSGAATASPKSSAGICIHPCRDRLRMDYSVGKAAGVVDARPVQSEKCPRLPRIPVGRHRDKRRMHSARRSSAGSACIGRLEPAATLRERERERGQTVDTGRLLVQSSSRAHQ